MLRGRAQDQRTPLISVIHEKLPLFRKENANVLFLLHSSPKKLSNIFLLLILLLYIQ